MLTEGRRNCKKLHNLLFTRNMRWSGKQYRWKICTKYAETFISKTLRDHEVVLDVEEWLIQKWIFKKLGVN
jgi:hypothetical protein